MGVIVKALTEDKLVYDLALATEGKVSDKEPTSAWMDKMYASEHSPIRGKMFRIDFGQVPYWVAMHFVRHKVGVEWFVSTQRTDRTGVARESLPQDNLVGLQCVINAQAIIGISRKRLCYKASKETREVWEQVVEQLPQELKNHCLKDCEYRGDCNEISSCGWFMFYT